eukprot:snap_masked-scaffold_24-processed-gene-4.3-mRNA-1 protein AED:1.00 eAED:1.00 QI:0/-1/0/0/-1/1/1/0/402
MNNYLNSTTATEALIILILLILIRKFPKATLLTLSIFSAYIVYFFNGLFPFLPTIENFHETNIGRNYVKADKMKGVVYTRNYTAEHQIEWKDGVNIPNFSHRQVLIKVKAAGINPVDYKLNFATYPFIHYFKDFLSGKDFSGVVIEKGNSNECSHLFKEQEVYGMSFLGTFAEYIVTYCEWTYQKPEKLSFEQAAGIPSVSLTAFSHLEQIPEGFEDKNILVVGGSGGCGLSVLQYLKQVQNKDKRLVSINSVKNNNIVRKMGAKEVLNYNIEKDMKAFVEDKRNENVFSVIYGAVKSYEYFEFLTPVLRTGAIWLPVDMHDKTMKTIFQTYIPWMNPKKVVMKMTTSFGNIERMKLMNRIYGDPENVIIQEVIDLKDNISLWEGFSKIKSRTNVGKVVFRL